jgi:rubrerythrin
MKLSLRSGCIPIAAIALALSFGVRAYAETPREELAHAYVLLKLAHADYGGHRAKAMEELQTAGKELGLNLEGRGSEHESQLKSDEQVAEAGRILREARNRLEAADRDRVAAHLEKAVLEIDAALKVGGQSQAYTETARQELAHAYILLKLAHADYGGHRAKAMEELQTAGKELGLNLEGRGSEHESQLKSDEQVAEAGRILREARDRLEAADRDRVATHLEKAVVEIDAALKVK